MNGTFRWHLAFAMPPPIYLQVVCMRAVNLLCCACTFSARSLAPKEASRRALPGAPALKKKPRTVATPHAPRVACAPSKHARRP